MNDRVEIIGESTPFAHDLPVNFGSSQVVQRMLHAPALRHAPLRLVVCVQPMTWATAPRPHMWPSQTPSG